MGQWGADLQQQITPDVVPDAAQPGGERVELGGLIGRRPLPPGMEGLRPGLEGYTEDVATAWAVRGAAPRRGGLGARHGLRLPPRPVHAGDPAPGRARAGRPGHRGGGAGAPGPGGRVLPRPHPRLPGGQRAGERGGGAPLRAGRPPGPGRGRRLRRGRVDPGRGDGRPRDPGGPGTPRTGRGRPWTRRAGAGRPLRRPPSGGAGRPRGAAPHRPLLARRADDPGANPAAGQGRRGGDVHVVGRPDRRGGLRRPPRPRRAGGGDPPPGHDRLERPVRGRAGRPGRAQPGAGGLPRGGPVRGGRPGPRRRDAGGARRQPPDRRRGGACATPRA